MCFSDSSNSPRRGGRRAGGFSLAEIMLVIAIIGLLAGLVTVNVRSHLIRAKQNLARHEMRTVMDALETFNMTYSRYPTNDEGLKILAQPTEKLPEGPLTAEPKDPWDRSYQYNSPGASRPYELICYGADGREGGQGADADITSEQLED